MAVNHEVDRALKGLVGREIVTKQGDTWQVAPGEDAVLAFYANSVAHFFADDAAQAK